MKKFLAIIILSLCFIISSQADDIRDFQIERMSLGDSLLDRFSKKEMNNKQKIYHYATKDYYQVLIDENIEMYDVVTVHLKENDNNFIIKNIEGVIGFEDKNKKKCENKMKEIGKSIEENFSVTDTLSIPLREARESFEKEYLISQIKKFGGNISKTAKFVGMERSALHRKLKLLGVKDLN